MSPGDTACSLVRRLRTWQALTVQCQLQDKVAQSGSNVSLASKSRSIITIRTSLPVLKQWWIRSLCCTIVTSFSGSFCRSRFCQQLMTKTCATNHRILCYLPLETSFWKHIQVTEKLQSLLITWNWESHRPATVIKLPSKVPLVPCLHLVCS